MSEIYGQPDQVVCRLGTGLLETGLLGTGLLGTGLVDAAGPLTCLDGAAHRCKEQSLRALY
tara:strand:- start:149 stop:331 length:183 start_codon:yes stop_codon:yes gene_type:complete